MLIPLGEWDDDRSTMTTIFEPHPGHGVRRAVSNEALKDRWQAVQAPFQSGAGK